MSEKHDYILGSDGELYRTSVSRRAASDKELMHWKYTKREKVNGEWRYWYDDDDEQAALDELNGLIVQITGRYRQEVTKTGDGMYRYTYYETETGGLEKSIYNDHKGMAKFLNETISNQERDESYAKAEELGNRAKRAIRIAEVWVSDNLDKLFQNETPVSLSEAEERAKKRFPGLWN